MPGLTHVCTSHIGIADFFWRCGVTWSLYVMHNSVRSPESTLFPGLNCRPNGSSVDLLLPIGRFISVSQAYTEIDGQEQGALQPYFCDYCRSILVSTLSVLLLPGCALLASISGLEPSLSAAVTAHIYICVYPHHQIQRV